MGSCGSLCSSLLITISVALITYNLIVSSTAPLRSVTTDTFPGPQNPASTFHLDPVIRMPLDRPKSRQRRLFHTAVTASDSVYNTWQCRVMYYWFKKARAAAGDESEMGGFTRILHSGKPDRFVDEIPTFVADPLPAGSDQGYIVLNRPWAFVQWLQKANIQEDYVLMAEPDHLIVKPIPNLSKDGLAAAFPFFYIEPKKYERILRKYFPEDKGPITNIDNIGNSPVIIDKESLQKMAPTWMNVSLAMKKDPETDKAFGWVLEMYAYAVSSAFHGVGNILHKDFMIQPPWDTEVGDKYIIHFTYGCDYNMKGQLTYGKIGEWRFDKRSYDSHPPPRNLMLPPDGVPESVVSMNPDDSVWCFHVPPLIRIDFAPRFQGRLFSCFYLSHFLKLSPFESVLDRQQHTVASGILWAMFQKLMSDTEAHNQVTLVKMVNEATANIPDWDAYVAASHS